MDIYVNSLTRYLFAQSWQVALLAVIVALISFALRNRSAHIRYLLWLIVLAKCIVPPVYSVKVPVLPERPLVEHQRIPVSPQRQAMGPIIKGDTDTIEEVKAVVQPQESRLALPSTKEMAILTWLTGMFLFLLWIGSKAVRYHLWLHRRRRPVPTALAQEFQELFVGFKFKKSPRIWLTKGIAQPFVWGLFRGSVYLPADFTSVDNPSHHRTVLVHELSHIARFDAAVNLLQILVQAIFWFHPFVWGVNKKIRQEREKCCDEMTVAQLSTAPEHYADAIVEALAAERRSAYPVPSLAIVGSVKDIEERIKTMLKPGKRFYRRPSVVVAMTVLALALITVPTALVLTVRAATEIDIDPPHFAAFQGNITAVEQWLAQGGNVNVKNAAGETLLRRALLGGYQDIIQLLQKHGANVDAEIQNDPSLITRVATNGSPAATEYLISRGADTSHVYVASYLGKLDQVKEYIETGSQEVSASDKYNILMGAITGGQANIIEYILDHGADIKRWEIFDIAVRANRKHILELLIAKGADPNPGAGWSPLHITIFYHPRLEMAKALLSHGADPFVGPWHPMHYAIESENKDMVQLFLDHSRDTDLIPYAYYAITENCKDVLPLFEPCVEISPIHLACFYGKLDDVKSYLEQGNDIEAQAIGGLSLLQFAVVGCQMEIVDYLIAQGCNIHSKASDGSNALHLAANGNDKGQEMIQRLITAGALVEAKDNDNCTPFFYSLSGASDDLGAAQVLLQHGADINIQRKSNGYTALHDAANRGNMERIKWLIARGADVNRRKKDGSTPLSVAMNRRRFGAVKYFLEHGADINCHDERGRTPLNYAAALGMKEVVEMVLNKGADINSRDNWGRTPLHWAVSNSRKEIVEMILRRNADITVQDTNGRTATGIAKDRGFTEIVELLNSRARQLDPKAKIMTISDYAALGDTEKIKSLIAAGQDVNIQGKTGGYALLWASLKGHREIAELLIQNGADVNIQGHSDTGGFTALILACGDGRKEIVELLLANGADINIKNAAGNTALDIASQGKYTEIVELLKKHGAKE